MNKINIYIHLAIYNLLQLKIMLQLLSNEHL